MNGPTRRRLTRSRHRKMIAGSAAASPSTSTWTHGHPRAYILVSIVSVAFPGILAYIILMFVMPPPHPPGFRELTGRRILVTNDDGVFSEGIERLAAALSDVGDVFTVAPDQERSAAGHSLTLRHPLRAKIFGPQRWSVDGTPTDCVNWGGPSPEGRAPQAPRLRHQPGLESRRRRDILGTVSAAFEGTLIGIPRSRSRRRSRRGSPSTRRPFAPPREASAGVAAAGRHPRQRQRPGRGPEGRARHPARPPPLGEDVIEKKDPRGRPYYWIGATPPKGDLEEGTDLSSVSEKCIASPRCTST